MLETLFKFPFVMVDPETEERKRDMALPSDTGNLDYFTGEAEVPYQDFVSITDRWLPSEDSLERAKEGIFDACCVVFGMSGTFIVPWTKERFKKEYIAFVQSNPDTKQQYQVSILSKKDLQEVVNKMDDDDEPKSE